MVAPPAPLTALTPLAPRGRIAFGTARQRAGGQALAAERPALNPAAKPRS